MEPKPSDDILDLIVRKEKKNRKRNLLIISALVIIGVLFTLFAMMNIFQSGKKAEKLELVKDSVVQVNQGFERLALKEDSVRRIAYLFQHKKELLPDSLLNLFAEKVERFYKVPGTTNTEVVKMSNDFWKRYPEEEFRYDSGYSVKNIDSTIVSVFMTGNYCRSKSECRDLIEEIRINKDYKICFVRAYYNEK